MCTAQLSLSALVQSRTQTQNGPGRLDLLMSINEIKTIPWALPRANLIQAICC